MKKSAVILLVLILWAITAPARAEMGDVAASIDTPGPCPTGLAFDGSRLWVADRRIDCIYSIEPSTGKVLREYRAPGYFPAGLCFDGKSLWVSDLVEKKIYRMDVETGYYSKEIDFPTPSVTGLAWDGKNLWACDGKADKLMKLDNDDGTALSEFPAPAGDSTGMTFDGTYFWCSDRGRDCFYLVSPENGEVLFEVKAPGKYAWGLAWDGNFLWNADYQSRKIFRIKVRGEKSFTLSDKRESRITVTSFIHSYGPGAVKTLDFNLALPEERPSQKFLSPPKLDPEPSEIVSDQYGQKVARYVVKDLAAGGEKKVCYTLDAALWAIRWFIYPDSVGTLAEIPSEVKGRYLFDGKKYDITHPYIREIIKRVAGDEKNPYWIARKLYDYLIQHMEYKLEGGWNSAPEALKRGTGSCSEYTFCYIALCRAAGIPARYVGSVVMRGDEASLDDVFHRWCEIYLPSYGWIPVDPDAGDEPLPADRARAFGGTKNHYLITTSGGGDSLFLKWSYNLVELWSFEGKCRLYIENIAEWEPLK